MEEYTPKCILCQFGKEIRLTGHVLCLREGITQPHFCCSQFVMNYLKLQPKRLPQKRKKQFTPDDFTL